MWRLTYPISYEHVNSVTLSFPLSPVLTFLTILLPLLAAANAFALPYLTRSSMHTPKSLLNPTHPAIPQVLQGILTTVLATLYATYIVPGDAQTCELSTLWQRLFRGKNDQAIRAVQDTFECCGFRSVKDMAWPFPPAAVPCTTRFDRDLACHGPWTSALQRNSGVQFGVVVVVGLLQVRQSFLTRLHCMSAKLCPDHKHHTHEAKFREVPSLLLARSVRAWVAQRQLRILVFSTIAYWT